MVMKSNKEIIIKELKKIHGEYMVAKALAIISGEDYKNEDAWRDKFFKPLATKLLSKLQRLDREEVLKILRIGAIYMYNLAMGDLEKMADQILQLIPEEGVVVGKGKITYDIPNLNICFVNGKQVNAMFRKLIGKAGVVKFIEDNK